MGLPNVEKLQEQMIKNAEKYLRDMGGSQYQELIAIALRPMQAYQQWLQRLMARGTERESDNG